MKQTPTPAPSATTVATATAVLAATLAADPAVSPDMKRDAEAAVRAVLAGETFAGATRPTPDGDRIVSRSEAAKMLNCTGRYVTILGKRGAIRKIVTNADGERALGYSFRSIQDFIGGGNR